MFVKTSLLFLAFAIFQSQAEDQIKIVGRAILDLDGLASLPTSLKTPNNLFWNERNRRSTTEQSEEEKEIQKILENTKTDIIKKSLNTIRQYGEDLTGLVEVIKIAYLKEEDDDSQTVLQTCSKYGINKSPKRCAVKLLEEIVALCGTHQLDILSVTTNIVHQIEELKKKRRTTDHELGTKEAEYDYAQGVIDSLNIHSLNVQKNWLINERARLEKKAQDLYIASLSVSWIPFAGQFSVLGMMVHREKELKTRRRLGEDLDDIEEQIQNYDTNIKKKESLVKDIGALKSKKEELTKLVGLVEKYNQSLTSIKSNWETLKNSFVEVEKQAKKSQNGLNNLNDYTVSLISIYISALNSESKCTQLYLQDIECLKNTPSHCDHIRRKIKASKCMIQN